MKKRELENYELIRKTLGAEKKYFGCQKAKTIEKFLSVLNKITFFGKLKGMFMKWTDSKEVAQAILSEVGELPVNANDEMKKEYSQIKKMAD